MVLLGSLWLDSLAALALIAVIAYIYGSSEFGYFKKRGIPYVRPLPFVGNFGGVLVGKHSVHQAVGPLYEQLKQYRFGGIFQGRAPTVLICDPEMIKLVLTKDFASVHERGTSIDEGDALNANLFVVKGARWKSLRSKMAPVFTSGKLKQMLPLMSEVSEELSAVLRGHAVKGDTVEMKDFLLRYATDVIGTCAFGIQCHSLKDPKSEFYRMGKDFFKPSLKTILRLALFPSSKILAKLFPSKDLFSEHFKFFFSLTEDTIKYRKENNVERNDLVQMMMQLQKNDETKKKEEYPDEVIFDKFVLVAQTFIFFVAGLDGIAGTVGFALHHLSIDTRIQDDLADEIHSVMSHHNGQITYDALKEMKLLEMVVSETFRMYPPGSLNREVTSSSYTIPGTDFTVEKGTKIQVPVFGLHYDPNIYPDPERFDPYRFTEEAISLRHPFTYLPFGEGPRMCIAERFAILEVKLCLASLIKDYKFNVCSETQIPLKLQAYSFSVAPAKGVFLKIEERKV